MEEENLTRLLRKAPSRESERTSRCPEEQLVAAFVTGALEPEERQRIEAHTANCSACLEEVAFLLREEDLAYDGDVPPGLLDRVRERVSGEISARRRWRWMAVASAAAAGFLIVSLWSFVPLEERAQDPSFRSTRGDEVSEANIVVLFPEEGTTVTPEELELRWQPVPNAVFYEASLLSVEGNVVWQTRLEETRARPQDEVVLTPGATYFVSLRGHLAGGIVLKSISVSFTLGTLGTLERER